MAGSMGFCTDCSVYLILKYSSKLATCKISIVLLVSVAEQIVFSPSRFQI